MVLEHSQCHPEVCFDVSCSVVVQAVMQAVPGISKLGLQWLWLPRAPWQPSDLGMPLSGLELSATLRALLKALMYPLLVSGSAMLHRAVMCYALMLLVLCPALLCYAVLC